jgi:hypothetical protein
MPRPRTGQKGKATNIYLNPEVKKVAAELARVRYGCSLSGLIEHLLRHEVTAKKHMPPSRATCVLG